MGHIHISNVFLAISEPLPARLKVYLGVVTSVTIHSTHRFRFERFTYRDINILTYAKKWRVLYSHFVIAHEIKKTRTPSDFHDKKLKYLKKIEYMVSTNVLLLLKLISPQYLRF